MPRKRKKQLEIREKLLAEVPDLWDYVRENCTSLEAWKHQDAIADFLTERVESIILEETEASKAKLDRVMNRMGMLKDQVSKLRLENGEFKRERHRYAPQLEEIRARYEKASGNSVRDGNIVGPGGEDLGRYSSKAAEKFLKDHGDG